MVISSLLVLFNCTFVFNAQAVLSGFFFVLSFISSFKAVRILGISGLHFIPILADFWSQLSSFIEEGISLSLSLSIYIYIYGFCSFGSAGLSFEDVKLWLFSLFYFFFFLGQSFFTCAT